jgi:hypothetical protein
MLISYKMSTYLNQFCLQVGAQLADHDGLDGVMMLDAWVSEAL